MRKRWHLPLCLGAATVFAPIQLNAQSIPGEVRRAYVVNSALAKKLVKKYPELGSTQGFEGIPFDRPSDEIAGQAMQTRQVTPVDFPLNSAVISPNLYVIYSIPCAVDFSQLCHYLGVTPGFGLPQHRIYGPVSLP